ncbi:MAG TPA: branched-chain amino acid ABC transporter permease/ATP-binding protein [Acidimicrobiia bacterium]|nr:branched-chain amino acid ABC transporter permease/ATP-binding protein [Acidimicrobiia bacterium]
MSDLLPFVVSGIAAGAIYGMAGTGLVLTYKTSGIFNFGYGAIATAAAYLFYWLEHDQGVDWTVALVVAVFVAGPLMGVAMERIARRLSLQSTASKIVGTVGLILVVQGLASVAYGPDTIRVDQYLPKAFESFRLFDVNVLYPQLWVTLVGLVVVVLLYVLFRFARTGVAMRAVVDDPDLVAMQATNPVRIRLISWMIGCTFAALSGVLVLPFVGLNSITLTFLVVQAFGAAAVGAFASIPLTFAGGVLIGVAADLSKHFLIEQPSLTWLSGIPGSLPFIVLFVALLVLPKRRLVPPSALEHRPKLQWRGPPRLQVLTGVVVLAVLAAVPSLVDSTKLGYFTIGLTTAIIILSLGLLVRTSGQVSLCHATFAAIGAVAFSQFTLEHGVPWFAALVLAALVAVPVGAIVAVPAIRLSGLFLALATFGFGIMVEQLLYSQGFMFTILSDGRKIPRPSIATDDTSYYFLCLAFLVVTALVMVAIHRCRLGRLLRGLSDAPVAVSTMGLSTNVTRVLVFCISAFFAAVAGILYGGAVHFATTADTHYQSFQSLVLLAVLALSPFAEPWYAVFAGATAVIPGYLTGETTPYWLNFLFGLSAVLVSLQGGTPSMPARLRTFFARFGKAPAPARAGAAALPVPLAAGNGSGGGPGLEVRELSVRFGGLVAVESLSFRAPMGRITGLIGPNGAGKTTTFDACSGLNRRVSGTILVNGVDVTRRGPSARGRLGIGRTFQRMQLGDSLTVAENVALGREAGQAGGRVRSQLVASPAQRREADAATTAALELCGIADLAGEQAGTLSTGRRRLVELARCLAGSFDVLLLDEPSSGLDRDETAAFDEVLRNVVRDRGCAVLLVEHDMSLVLNVCSYVYVLDFGRLIFEGDPPQLASSPVVQAAYLGGDVTLSGATQDVT